MSDRRELERLLAGLESRLVAELDARDRLAADRLDVLRERLEGLLAAGAGAAGGPAFASPDQDAAELALLGYVAPFVGDRHAIDVGAHRGRYAEALAELGFDVVAAEPHPALADELGERLARFPGATVRAVAADEAPGTTTLHLADAPDGAEATLFSTLVERDAGGPIAFRPGPEVETTTVDLLRRDRGWPEEVGVVKVDVEGAEDRVLAGLGDTRPEVLMVEFWGPGHVLSLPGREAIVRPPGERLRSVAFVHHGERVEFAIEPEAVPDGSWGNVFFFRRFEAFNAAARWCGAHLGESIARPA